MTTETIQPGSPTGAPSEADVRSHLHGMWASVAGAWGEHAGYADERGAAITEELLDRAAIRSGDRVLELACGPGGAGLSAAARVGPDGEVVLSDVAEQMTAIAADRAAARVILNVRTLVLDLEEIDQPDGSYDVVLCREGLMFALDPARPARIRHVLRTDGRVSMRSGELVSATRGWASCSTPWRRSAGPCRRRNTRPVLARRRRRGGAAPARCGLYRRHRHGTRHTAARGLVRRVVGSHIVVGRSAGHDARGAAGRRVARVADASLVRGPGVHDRRRRRAARPEHRGVRAAARVKGMRA